MSNKTIEAIYKETPDVAAEYPFEIFLCGPSLCSSTPSSDLRNRIMIEFEKNKFDVVLGEDDGLEKLKEYGINDSCHFKHDQSSLCKPRSGGKFESSSIAML